ncbi:MAG: ATP-binding cassette domain-containing protein [Acidobacteriota bacterium]
MVPAVAIEDLTKSFKGHLSVGRHPVLKGVTLEVPRGGIYGFLGPNGAGKTTTLKILMGLLFADSGHVRILGRPLGDPSARARIGFLPEAPYFYDYLTGSELLDFMGRLFGLSARETADRGTRLLRTVGLEGKGGLQLRKYSKGMLQRIGLAQALINDPELVLLDEPMSGLDPIGRREIRDLILDLRHQGKTVFFSSHILADAEAICDAVAILMGGRVVREGPLDSLLGSEVRFWDVTLLAQTAFAPPPDAEILARMGSQVLVRVSREEALQTLLDEARRAGARVRSVTPQKVSLEDLFLAQVPPGAAP